MDISDVDITDVESGDPSALALSAQSTVTGSWEGTICLQCGRKLVEKLAIRLFDLDDKAPSDEDLQDALAEFCNIVVGNLKATLPAASCSHSVPKVTPGPLSSPTLTPETQSFWFSTSDGNLLLSVIPALPLAHTGPA